MRSASALISCRASFRSPMAVAVIGGIIVSTVLSLIVVPSFFLIMDDLSRLLSRIFSRFVGPREDEEGEDLSATVSNNAEEIGALKERLARLEAEEHRSPRLVLRRDAAE